MASPAGVVRIVKVAPSGLDAATSLMSSSSLTRFDQHRSQGLNHDHTGAR